MPVVYLKENRTTQTVCCRDRLKEAERSSNKVKRGAKARKPEKEKAPRFGEKVRGPVGFSQ